MDDQLTPEQELLIKSVAVAAVDLSRTELIAALVRATEEGIRTQNMMVRVLRDAGYQFQAKRYCTTVDPRSPMDLETHFGYEPSESEILNFMEQLHELHTEEIDFEGIVTGD